MSIALTHGLYGHLFHHPAKDEGLDGAIKRGGVGCLADQIDGLSSVNLGSMWHSMPVDYSSFPASYLTTDNKAQFLIQDPFGLREVIQPVVSISQIEDKITGLGTCFRVSPWSWLTAQHVVSDKGGAAFPENEVGAVGFSPGLIFGTVGFKTPDYFGEINEIRTAKKVEATAPSFLPGPKEPDMLLDLAALRVVTINLKKKPLISPLPLSRSQPKVGDELIGIGFPILGSSHDGSEAIMRFEERMYGASGVVTTIHPNGVSPSRPWPTLEIEGDWRGGMSGGPVIDLNGQVVGIISRSLAPLQGHAGVGWAVDLTRMSPNTFAVEIDPANPGWSLGWATFSGKQMTGFFETQQEAEHYRTVTEADQVKLVSHCPKTDSWMAIQS